jgi:hypothetical protein
MILLIHYLNRTYLQSTDGYDPIGISLLLLAATSFAPPRSSDVRSRLPAINLPNRTRSADLGAGNTGLWLEIRKLGIVGETTA